MLYCDKCLDGEQYAKIGLKRVNGRCEFTSGVAEVAPELCRPSTLVSSGAGFHVTDFECALWREIRWYRVSTP